MFRAVGIACLAFAAVIALVAATGLSDHIDKPVPAVVFFAVVGAGCLWLFARHEGRRH